MLVCCEFTELVFSRKTGIKYRYDFRYTKKQTMIKNIFCKL